MRNQIEMVKRYIALVETLQLDMKASSELLHDDYQQWELPNQLNKNGQKSDRADSLSRLEKARKILSSQKYSISSILEQGNTVVIEALWSGTVAIDLGTMKKGHEMKAYFCMIFEFKEGLIHRIRNYDCFESYENI